MTATEMFEIILNAPGDGSGGTTINGHDFARFGLDEGGVLDIVEFLQTQLVDTDEFIAEDGRFLGDIARGENAYFGAGYCLQCHGDDGTMINFGSTDDPEWVGTIAVANPWEFLHKIRFGQPDSNPPMPSWVATQGSNQGVVDIGRFVQERLPTGRAPQIGSQRPGDCNQDSHLDISDALCLLGHLFLGAPRELPCEGRAADDSGEANLALLDGDGDGEISLSDAVGIVQFLFSGAAPPSPCVDARCSDCVVIEGCPDIGIGCPQG
jgi:mono/diheme cytochrome c family protein